jgi:dienelactone hydrolase
MSGCRGVGPREESYARQFKDYARLIVDSMSARGLWRGVCHRGDLLRPHQRAADIWWAINFLARHPRIDRRRIGLIGWSHGGSTVLAWLEQVQGRKPPGLATAIVFYPGCRWSGRRLVRPPVPVLMLLAGKDDWTPPVFCHGLARRLRRGGAVIQVIEFPAARHSFDNPAATAYRVIPSARGGRGAVIGYDESAAARARVMVRDWLGRYLSR